MPTFSLPPSPPYLIAFSGGADSRLLLELTVRALLERDPKARVDEAVTAAHLHHGIRGAEADRDEAFCRRVCAELGVSFLSERVNVPALAEATGESLETAARRARYRFFRRIMDERNIPTLLTAHHADDNLETILDRLLRGSGIRGMGGIPPSRPFDADEKKSGKIIHRPLLDWTKREILDACAEWGLDFVTDSTNEETAYTRNYLRHTVIPAMEQLAGAGIPQRSAARLARSAREDEACLSGMAETQVDRCLSPNGDGLRLEVLQRHYPAISKRMMAILYDRATASVNPQDGSGTLSTAHLDALSALMAKADSESSLSLPRGMEARIRGDWLYIRPAEVPPAPAAPVILPEGITPWGKGVRIVVEKSASPLPPAEGDGVWASAVFPADLPTPLRARCRQAGDEILSHGMHKKLKKLLCDKGIPPHLRDAIPLICLPDGSPLWYPGAVFRDGYPPPRDGGCVRVTVIAESGRAV